jgi:hypothetical protein
VSVSVGVRSPPTRQATSADMDVVPQNYLRHRMRPPGMPSSTSVPVLAGHHRRQLPKAPGTSVTVKHHHQPSLPVTLPALPPSFLSLAGSPTLPTFKLADPERRAGVKGAKQLLRELLSYAEAEMHARGVPRSGYSEARLGIWLEVQQSLLQHLPSYREVFVHVQREQQTALDAVRNQLRALQVDLAKAWEAQERAEASRVAAKQIMETELQSARAELEKELAVAKEALEVQVMDGLKADDLAVCLTRHDETQRADAMCCVFASMRSKSKRHQAINGLAAQMSVAEQAAFVQQAFDLAPDEEEANFADERVDRLLMALPDSMRAKLGVRAMHSLQGHVRQVALAEVQRADR